jgi:YD repeat-containing protein
VYRQAVYTYYQGTYTGNDTYGNQGDLKTVTIEDGGGNALNVTYYRYYTPADLAGGQQGYIGGLKYSIETDSYSKLTAVYSNPFTATDAQVAPFANHFFAYDSSQRAIEETAADSGSSSNNGLGTTTFAYYQNPSFPTSGTPDFNTWWMRTTETLPDGNQNIVYTNINKQALLFISVDTVDAASPSTVGVKEITAYQFDSFGRLITTINSSAINNSFYNLASPSTYEAYNDVGITEGGVNSSSGLVQTTSYYSSTTATGSTAGGAAGFAQADYLQQGLSGTPVEQDSYTYFAHTDSNGNTIYPQAAYTLYRNSNGTGAETTSYSYAFYTGTNQPYSIATSAPVISSGQNGPGTADVTTDVYDTYGNQIWEKDPNGYISYNGVDLPTGAVVQFIQDLNTSSLSGLVDDVVPLPTGWTTPTGAGLNLVTAMQVDNLGRTTGETSPNGNVTYVIYDDPDHEVRIYTGWNASTGTTTGPTQIYREDWSHSYAETITTFDAPAVSGTSGSYVPTGTETITAANIQSLSRTLMNDSDQVIETDDYFTMSGISSYSTTSFHLGTAGTNYYPTTYAFDAEGRQYQTTEPTGTIDVITYDGFDRAIGSWVGTNATTSDGNPFNGNNAGTGNNMVELESDVYDNGGAGDSNVTTTTDYPGGGQPNRITQTAYDWRDRPVASESGIATGDTTTPRSIAYTTYDNLDEPTERDTYDGTGILVSSLGSTGGVPNAPSSQLLAKQTAAYDDQGRVYQSSVYSVDPSTGTVGSSITTNAFYDHNGNVLAVFTPGQPTMKYLYDGANRVTATYTTDGGAVNNSGSPLLDWSDAGSVANDVVVSETDTTYDGDDNTILTVSKDRLPTSNTTTTGALDASLARISYVGDFYDAADRLTAEENVGTNGGSAWTLPSAPDSRDDSHLITSYTYDAAGNQDSSTDPRGIVAKTLFDMLGRTTETIAAYTNGVPTSDTNQTTTYTYDGNGDVLTMTAVMPSGTPSQTTAYIYGVGVSGGLFSNDLFAGVEYPDPTTGYASGSAANDVSYAYDNLGETTVKIDQNGTTHDYSYDPLGRLTLDAVTLASGNPQNVDTSVLALGYSYNALSLP